MADLITQEQLKHHLHYDPETGVFTWIRPTNWRIAPGTPAGNIKTNYKSGYKSTEIQVLGRMYSAGRLAWLYVTGKWPNKLAEHKDGDATNQKWDNLREADNFVNSQNMHKAPKSNKSSGLLGVTRHPHKPEYWVARITVNKKPMYLGKSTDKVEAHNLYLEAKRKLHQGCTI